MKGRVETCQGITVLQQVMTVAWTRGVNVEANGNSLEEETAGLTESLGVGLWKRRVQEGAWDLDVSKRVDSHTILNFPASFASSPPAELQHHSPWGSGFKGHFLLR